MKKIYAITVTNAVYENNEVKEFIEETILYAESNEDKAKEDVKRIEEKSIKDRQEWFKTNTYGIFPYKCNYREIDLY